MYKEGEGLSSKWAKKLGSKCDIDLAALEFMLEELSESCYGDASTSKKVIEQLTLKCNFNRHELSRFISEVSQNCPMDAKKLRMEIDEAKGKKELAFQAIYNVAGKTR